MTQEQRADKLSKPEIVSLLVANDSLQTKVETLQEKLAAAEHQLCWFKKQLFGQKSEQRKYIDDSRQLYLGKSLESEEQRPQPTQQVEGYQRGRAPKKLLEGTPEDSGLRFGPDVPVKTIYVENPELEGLSEDDYEVITEENTYRLAQQPGSYVVLKYVNKVVKLKDAEHPSSPPPPSAVIERSLADVSFLVGLQIDKFLYHLPLYRQHQRLKDAGIVLSRATLTNLVHRSIQLLEPIYQAQYSSILESLVLAMDEIAIKAGRKSKGKLSTSYFWPLYGDKDEICFAWCNSRAHKHVPRLLDGFNGILLSDGYDAYEKYAAKTDGVIQAQCWNHSRREFVEALESEPVLCQRALNYIGKLYKHEEEIRELGLEEEKKLLYRVEHCKPVVEEFFDWLEKTLAEHVLLPKSPFTKAANYVFKREEQLKVFLRFPEVQIDTNHEERELRVVAVGRNNWKFCWTEVGAQYVGIIQSLLRTCILHQVNPHHYLVDVLQRIDTHPQNQVNLLTPRLWKEHFADKRLKSPLEMALAP